MLLLQHLKTGEGYLLEELLQDAWQATTWREGTKGNLTKEFTRVRVYRVGRRSKPLPTAGWLIGQRPLPGQQGESKYCFAWGLDSLSLQDQVVLAAEILTVGEGMRPGDHLA